MRQRVAFLRTLLAGKPVLLLDEPFASLDAITRAEMQEWLAEALAAESRTAMLVTHDVEEALYLSRPGGGALGPAGSRGRRAAPARAARPAAHRTRSPRRLHRRARARPGGADGRQAMRRWLAPVAIVIALLGVWELAARLDVLASA